MSACPPVTLPLPGACVQVSSSWEDAPLLDGATLMTSFPLRRLVKELGVQGQPVPSAGGTSAQEARSLWVPSPSLSLHLSLALRPSFSASPHLLLPPTLVGPLLG